MVTYVSIKSHGPKTHVLVVLWERPVGPVFLDGVYKTRVAARNAATKLLGKDRKIISLTKLYQIHETRYKEQYYKYKERKSCHSIQ